MLRAAVKSLLARKLRLALSGMAVVLGVMFVSGAFVLTDTLGRSFDNLFATVYEHTDVQVDAKPNVALGETDNEIATATVPGALVDQVRAVPGVAAATGMVASDGARVIGPGGKVITTFGPPRLGTNWVGDTALTMLREGRGPRAPDEVAVNASLAKAAGVKVGDPIDVLTLQPKRTFRVVGIIEYSGGRDTIGGTTEVAFVEPVAQELMLGRTGMYSSIEVRAGPGVTPEKLRDDINAALGGQYQVRTGEQLQQAETAGFREGLKFFNYVLLGFAGVALFVGIFLVLNTFSIIVAQRTRELALMRALGGSRRQMLGVVLVEAVVIGLIASVLGLGAGIGVGALLAWVFGNTGGAALELAGIGVPASAVIAAFAVGVLVTVVAAMLPAVRASRIPPVAALQEAASQDRPLTKITIAGAVTAAAGGALLGFGLAGSFGDATLWAILAGVLVSFVGVALLTPLIARPVVGLLGRLFSWSVPGKLGRLNSGRNPRRTAITAAALMVGLALITGVNTILSSATASLHKLADTQVKADLIISGDQMSAMPPTFDPAVLERTRQLPGVESVSGQYFDVALINGRQDGVAVVTDVPALASMFSLTATQGSLGALGTDAVAIDAAQATRHGLHVGDAVTVQLARGQPRTMTVAGVYAKNDVFAGWILPTSVVPDLRVPQPSWAYIKVASGGSVDEIRKQVDGLLADSPEVTVADRSGYIDQQTAQFDTVLLMIQILLALAVLIAVLGIVNTLALSVLERTRELGLLRAIGLNRAQAMRMVTVEAVVISVFGALLGIVVGAGLGAAVVRALRDEGFTSFALPWASIGGYLLVAAVVGVVAAIAPAIRAARVNMLQAIAYE